MQNLLIVEHNSSYSDKLKKIISCYGTGLNIYDASDSVSAELKYTNHAIDIFIIDIQLSDSDCSTLGIQMAESLRRMPGYRETPIIFTSASFSPETLYHAVNSIHCFSYIRKPFSAPEIYRALDDIYKYFNFPKDNELTIRDINGVYIQIKTDSIIYIESSDHSVIFHTKNGNLQSGRKCLADCLNMLDYRFIRSHKKYIINICYIKNYDKTNRMINIHNMHLPVGRSYKDVLDKIFP